MGRKSLFAISVCLWLGAGPITAQEFIPGIENYARIEHQTGLALIIGVENGRNFFQPLNQTGIATEITLSFEGYADSETGERISSEHMLVLAAHEIGEKFLIEDLFPHNAWITTWKGAPVETSNRSAPVDREAVPFFRTPPKYPNDCFDVSSDTEHIVVSYDISETGRVENILIRDMTNGCHALAAHRALRPWVYAPKLIGGKAVVREGMETLITFQLED